MNKVVTKNYAAPVINEREILRYAGCDAGNEQARGIMCECIDEASRVLSYKVCFTELMLINDGKVCDFGSFSVVSEKLCKNLAGCEKVLLFAATVGIALDRLIARYSRISPAKALFMQAVGSERVESLCDAFCEDMKTERNIVLQPRFSPGYGDVSIDVQKDIFRILNCPKNIGVVLNDSLLMSPSKTVTAFVGICK